MIPKDAKKITSYQSPCVAFWRVQDMFFAYHLCLLPAATWPNVEWPSTPNIVDAYSAYVISINYIQCMYTYRKIERDIYIYTYLTPKKNWTYIHVCVYVCIYIIYVTRCASKVGLYIRSGVWSSINNHQSMFIVAIAMNKYMVYTCIILNIYIYYYHYYY